MNEEDAPLSHRLCFLYYTLCVIGDGEIMDSEVSSVIDCIQHWDFVAGKKEASQIAEESLTWWRGTPLRERAELCIALFKNFTQKDILADKEHVLNDLIAIAKSDGVFTDTEKLFIEEVAGDLGINNLSLFNLE
jgi:tellurite resistance protein